MENRCKQLSCRGWALAIAVFICHFAFTAGDAVAGKSHVGGIVAQCRELAGFNKQGYLARYDVPKEAIEACERAVRERPGNADLPAYLARAYWKNGRREEAAYPARNSAERGSALGMAATGVTYEFGYGVAKDHSTATHWYQRGAEAGNIWAQANYAAQLVRARATQGNAEKAVLWYRKSAESGFAFAQRRLGLLYLNGIGVAKDPAMAMRWLTRAAAQSDTEAQYRLGVMYEKGIGVAADDAAAVNWYRLASVDHPQALFSLASRHETGRGVTKDRAEALLLAVLAAKRGHQDAKEIVLSLLIDGDVPDKAAKALFDYALDAADDEDSLAKTALGAAYLNGRGVQADNEMAATWFRKAAVQNDTARSIDYLVNGRSVHADDEMAAAWPRKAVMQNHTTARATASWMYATGRGVPKDKAAAVDLLDPEKAVGSSFLLTGLRMLWEDDPVSVISVLLCLASLVGLIFHVRRADKLAGLPALLPLRRMMEQSSDASVLRPPRWLRALMGFLTAASCGFLALQAARFVSLAAMPEIAFETDLVSSAANFAAWPLDAARAGLDLVFAVTLVLLNAILFVSNIVELHCDAATGISFALPTRAPLHWAHWRDIAGWETRKNMLVVKTHDGRQFTVPWQDFSKRLEAILERNAAPYLAKGKSGEI